MNSLEKSLITRPHNFHGQERTARQERESGEAATREERVPQDLISELVVCCLIHGIRYHHGFATKLRLTTDIPSITRALNGRDIMSNRIPSMKDPKEIPHCFWHPDVPSEETLRQLLKQQRSSTHMRYQVARACAAGGYTALYQDLAFFRTWPLPKRGATLKSMAKKSMT